MTHSYVCPDQFICSTWLIHKCAIPSSHSHESQSCHSHVTHMNESCHPFETDACVWHDPFMCDALDAYFLIHESCHSHVTHTNLSQRDGMTHSYMWHDCDMTYVMHMMHIFTSHISCHSPVTHINESCHTRKILRQKKNVWCTWCIFFLRSILCRNIHSAPVFYYVRPDD